MTRKIKNYCSLWCKWGLILALILPMAVVSGCGATTQVSDNDIRIGVAIYDQTDSFISTLCQDMERLAQELEQEQGIKITLSLFDGRSNQTTQLDQIDQMIAQQCDVICVNIVDRTAAAVLIDKAEAANIPLIFFNRQPVDEDMERWDSIYYVGADGKESGELQGEIVCDFWLNGQSVVDKNGDGILQYVMLEGEQGHQDALLRTQYSVSTLVANGINVEKLAGDTASWSRSQAKEKMTQWLGELDTAPEVVFANNDDMALGAIDAYLEEGYHADNLPVVVGVDGLDEAVLAVESGLMAGTVLNDGEGIAWSMLELSLALWRGEEPSTAVVLEGERYVWLPCKRITVESLS